LVVDVTYTLGGEAQFAEKRVVLTSPRDYRCKKVILSRLSIVAPAVQVVCYRYPKFLRPPGTEPDRTYFGRTAKGGFFTGVELPFDSSELHGRQVVLGYAPSLKVAAGEALTSEAMYLGVYRRGPADDAPSATPALGGPSAETPHHDVQGIVSSESFGPAELPLPAESAAMLAMTSAILGPPRHGLVPMACGWHSEMEQWGFSSAKDVEGDMRSLDFLAECGVDWVSDSQPWGGETEKMNALGANDTYRPGEWPAKLLDHARSIGVKVLLWSSMNNTHSWSPKGRPFRADRPDWLMRPGRLDDKPDLIKNAKANCLANAPFFNWLVKINLEGLATGYYPGWGMDGSFFGDGGWVTTVIPADCASDQHDHLPGDSNYACERALNRLIAQVRDHFPKTYIFTCRPTMDLGVWSLRNVDACFTLLETGTTSSNLVGGDEIRKWSRVRVQHDFFPHYLDQPLLFPSRGNRNDPPNWPRGKLDYILLSALSSSPNQLLYFPTKTGIPPEDKIEIRKWLDWGRKNIAYLQVRKDLPDWPGPGRVDGSAHVVGDRGLIFLFNSGKDSRRGEFALSEQSIGFKAEGEFRVRQEYPESAQRIEARSGTTVQWEVPGESVVLLRIELAK
jgi:hypothetical protein